MRKIKHLLFMIPFFLLQSCVEDEENIFGSSASDRMSEALSEYETVLTGAPNGWIMEYYPEEDHSIGGYTFLCSFNSSGEVIVASEISTSNFLLGDKVTSLYKLISDQGPVLSFDTYNEIFHYFSQPSSSDVNGYSGDYEFVFTSVTPELIVMKGKKHNNKIIMTPLAEGHDWTTYLQSIYDIADDSGYGSYKLYINGQEAGSVSQTERAFSFGYKSGDEIVTVSESFIYTTTGLKLYDPLTIGGVTIEHFDWNSPNKTFTCTDNGVNASLVVDLPDNYISYSDYIGTWTLLYKDANGGDLTTEISISQNIKNKSLLVSGLLYDIIMDYNMGTGTVEITTQYVGTIESFIVRLCPWSISAGYLTWSNGVGMVGNWAGESGNIKITFSDNGQWDNIVDSFLFYAFNVDGSTVGTVSRIRHLTSMTKK